MTLTVEQSRKWRTAILATLALSVVHLVANFVPAIGNTTVIGLGGRLADERFEIRTVLSRSPAAEAGVERGDILLSLGGTTVPEWHRLYRDDFDAYLSRLAALVHSPIELATERDGIATVVSVAPRPFAVADYPRIFGIRTVFGTFLLVLTIVLLVSGTRERAAFLCCLCFLFTLGWLFSGLAYWPMFLAPVFPAVAAPGFPLELIVETTLLQLACSLLVLVSMSFPGFPDHLEHHRWLPATMLATPLALLLLVAVVTPGSLVARLAAANAPRVWLNTGMLVVAAVVMVHGYRFATSALQRERARWLVASLVVAVASILLLWNISKLLLGNPLVPEFDWVLIPLALVPLAMTLAIGTRHLFGIKAIAGRRLRYLSSRLSREKLHLRRRDASIATLSREIEQLRSELQTYSAEERDSDDPSSGRDDCLERIVAAYPAIDGIRRERLLGASPVWCRIFEHIVVAARGSMPVLVVGESGTGKSDVGWSIHRLGPRPQGPFRSISCAQFEHADPAIALGRLFGIGRGHGLANAPRDGQRGLLEECDGGTLLLDDFDCLPMNVQNLLLYPLEGRAFEPGIGSGPPRMVAVKFVLATNRDPDVLVAEGKLRADVLARLGARVDIPPLRDRHEDIPVLVRHFLGRIAEELDHQVVEISSSAMTMLSRFDFRRGNARELRAEIHAAVGKAMLEGDAVLRAGYLSDRIRLARTPRPERSAAVPARAAGPSVTDTAMTERDTPFELVVLRRNGFRIHASEHELGLSHKSRTLSNRLRGICIKAVLDCGFDLDAAARLVTGCDDCREMAGIRRKIERYLDHVGICVAQGNESRLYNNLPAAYHDALDRIVERVRSGAT